MKNFPEHFVFGAATAAYQAEGAVKEGGRGKVSWDDFLMEQGKFDPSTASDFYHKYPEDLKLAHDFGLNGIRISIAWSRIYPNGNDVPSKEGIDFYHRLIDECIRQDIKPFVTLHHFDTPIDLYRKGDWLNKDTIDSYVNFSKFCFNEYGEKVKYWITINEPWSVVAGQYIIGHFPPNIKYDIPKAIQAMHNMMVAHSRVVMEYKKMNLKGNIGIVHILESKYAIDNNKVNEEAAKNEHVLANQFMLDATFRGYYAEDTLSVIKEILSKNHGELIIDEDDMNYLSVASKQIDFLGVNYYASHFIKKFDGESKIYHNGTGNKGSSVFALKGIGERVNNPNIPMTDWDWPIYPRGLEDMLEWIAKTYPNYKTIYITENGMGAKENYEGVPIKDTQRIEYIKHHLEAVLNVINKGINVQGYFLWSLMDVFSWTNGYNKRYGLFYVDFSTQERYPKESAYWYKNLIKEKILK